MDLPQRILVACSSSGCRQTLTDTLAAWEVEVVSASTVKEARGVLHERAISVVLCEDRLADGAFRDLLEAVASQKPVIPVIVFIHDESEYDEAKRLGAFEAVPIPYQRSDVQWAVIRAVKEVNSPSRPLPRPQRSG